MPIILAERSLLLLPGGADDRQSASYAFFAFDIDRPRRSATVEISYRSDGVAQLPVAVYGGDGAIRLTRSSEPAAGPVVRAFSLGEDSDGCALDAGTWKLVLHKRILSEPLEVRLRVFVAAPSRPGAKGRKTRADEASCPEHHFAFADARPDSGSGWYCGELHLHSNESTGRSDVATIRRVALERHLDFLALTDHFTPAHWDRIEELGSADGRPLFLRSVEIAGDRGHANLHGATGWPNAFPDDVDGRLAAFLGRPIAGSMEAAADSIHRQGGLFCVNHPLSSGAAWRYDSFPLEKADLLEVACLPDGPVSFLYPTLWDRLLCAGLRPTGVGSSDSHDPLQDGPWALGKIRNWVYAASLSREGIIEGLKAGRAYVAFGESRLEFSARLVRAVEGSASAGNAEPPLSGSQPRPMGSTLTLAEDESCVLRVALSEHPSGNLFVMKDGFLFDVRYFAAGEGPDIAEYRFEPKDLAARGWSFVRVEFHEDLEKARYHGMAFRDHRSLRLLSNPLWIRAKP